MAELTAAMRAFAKRPIRAEERADWDRFLLPRADALAALRRRVDDARREMDGRVGALFGLDADAARVVEAAAAEG